jgi:hypothetical protein
VTRSKLNPFVPTHVLYTNLGTPEETRTELAEVPCGVDDLDTDESSAFCSEDDWHSEERYSDWALDSERCLTFQGQAPGPMWGQHKIVRIENDVPQYKNPADYASAIFFSGYAVVNTEHDGGFVWVLGRTLEDVAHEWNAEYGPGTGFSDDSPRLNPDEIHSGYTVLDGRSDNCGTWWVAGLSKGAWEAVQKNGERSPWERKTPLVLVDGRFFALFSEVCSRGLAVEEDKYGFLRAA